MVTSIKTFVTATSITAYFLIELSVTQSQLSKCVHMTNLTDKDDFFYCAVSVIWKYEGAYGLIPIYIYIELLHW